MKIENSVRRILNSLSEPGFLIDRMYTVIIMNDAASTYFNIPSEKMLGRFCYQVIQQSDRPCFETDAKSCSAKEAFETNRIAYGLYQHRVGGRLFVTEIVATPLGDRSGESRYVVEEFRDITGFLDLEDTLLHVCSSCKRIRGKEGAWYKLNADIAGDARAEFSHSFCPDCMRRLYPEIK
jgi:PAS domain S-box-containing protein